MYDEEVLPVQDPASKHGMKLAQQNRLEIEPGWCYGRQGPLYLVACAVNSTLYEGTFNRFTAGQQARLDLWQIAAEKEQMRHHGTEQLYIHLLWIHIF